MKMMYCLLLFFLLIVKVYGQDISPDILCSSSGVLSNGSIAVSWTLGESVIATFKTSSNTVTSGFNQTNYEVATAVSNTASSNAIKIYPNPAKDQLLIQENDGLLDGAKGQIYDCLGQKIQDVNINAQTVIDCSKWKSSIYFLSIQTNGGSQEIYKITKL
jgi:hypothetical protein